MKRYDIIIIGGGAAGFFAAINIAEKKPDLRIAVLERGKEVLTKVKVSGGGRCNVTHAEFIPQDLVQFYPRGEKELLGPFHRFMTGDTIAWFEERGVALKIEDDGRMFPVTNASQTIIDCFLHQAKTYNVHVLKQHAVKSLIHHEQYWEVKVQEHRFAAEKLVVATGSNPKMWKLLEELGHHIIPPVPSLFTFDIKDERLKGIPGVVVKDVEVKVLDTTLSSEGPILVTHVGLSAPAILKLSAFGAIVLAKRNYQFKIVVNFVKMTAKACLDVLKTNRETHSKKTIYNAPQFELPKRLWHKLIEAARIKNDLRWADINKQQLEALAEQLTNAVFEVTGKSTFKEEFVTAGGVDLKEINFKTYESKIHENLYLAGEVLNIDAVTGGFNFQNAWTGAYIVSETISKMA
ncbi:MAG: NAD(P)/FAD-dependent oxidoreductase [Flavobacteriaceae bacterium]|nr:NAD(P)/FAD-dependent oxidoreductase [Flavobacteriaceae bacterium]